MLKCKKLIAAALAVAMLMSVGTSVFAYEDGDREVQYYDYALDLGSSDDVIAQQNNPAQRRFNRNWVVSITGASQTTYAISYTPWRSLWQAAASTKQFKGTGNTGGSYSSGTAVGDYIWLYVQLNPSEAPAGKYSRGQWSPDNAV